jgi:hypothetical protein
VSAKVAVLMTWSAPSSAPTKRKSPAGLRDADKGTAPPAREMLDADWVARLKTITNGKRRGGLGGGCGISHRM